MGTYIREISDDQLNIRSYKLFSYMMKAFKNTSIVTTL